MAKNDIPKSVKCSFCGKTQDNVRKIIAGPGVYICNECVGLCNEIIDAEYSDEDTYTLAELDEIPSPKEIKEILHLTDKQWYDLLQGLKSHEYISILFKK